MKKLMLMSLFLLTSILILTGCTTSKSFTYKVETGDSIKITLNTTDKYNLTSELPFKISKDKEVLSQGTFITKDGFDNYKTAVANDSGVKVIEENENNNIEYIFYSYNDKEYNYIINIKNSNTGLVIGNTISEESAKEVFKRLSFAKEEK